MDVFLSIRILSDKMYSFAVFISSFVEKVIVNIIYLTTCDQRFVRGLYVLLYSMKKHVAYFENSTVKVLYDPRISGFEDSSKSMIQKAYPNVFFQDVDVPLYREVGVRYEVHRPALLTIETFREREHERIVFLDSDTLFISNTDFSTFSTNYDYMGCKTGVSYSSFNGFSETWTNVNTGLIIASPNLNRYYDALIDYIRSKRRFGVFLDQEIINQVFRAKNVKQYILEGIYNASLDRTYFRNYNKVSRTKGRRVSLDKVILLHFSGYHSVPKPWSVSAESLAHLEPYKIWNRYYFEAKSIFPLSSTKEE